MAKIVFRTAGRFGVNKDLSEHELPIEAWTDSRNIRFLDGYARLILGEGEYYPGASIDAYHLLPVTLPTGQYWLYAGSQKIYAANISGGTITHTNLTRQSAGVDVNYTGAINAWTSTSLSGLPILNAGNTVDPPQSWDLNLGNRFVDLPNWPANTFCKALRGFKNFLIALNVTKSGSNYPYLVKWSHPAAPGSIPSSWDIADPTVDAGETDLGEGQGIIIDGMQLRDAFMVYKEDSIWRMELIGGPQIFNFRKVQGTSGALNRNCIAEFEGMHLVLTESDIILHDGQTPNSILDKVSRRWLFQNIDSDAIGTCFMFKNPFFNEIYICYPEVGSSLPNKALVWNYRDATVSYRDLPNIYCGAHGAIDAEESGTWNVDEDPWDVDETIWGQPDIVPANSRTLMGATGNKLWLLDSNYGGLGSPRVSVLERVGLSFDAPEQYKMVREIMPRITGQEGAEVYISVGRQDTPYETPIWTTKSYVIGTDVKLDFFVTGRYIAIKFETNTAYSWRLDSFDIDLVLVGQSDF